MKNQGNMAPSVETNKALISEQKEMENYKLVNKFKTILLKKFSKLQEHTGKQRKLGKQCVKKTKSSSNKR